MIKLLLGGYLLAASATGNAGALLDSLIGEGAFIPWAVAVAIFRWLWENTKPPEREPVRLLIVALAAGVLITERKRLVAGLDTAWQAINSLSGASLSGGNSGGGSGGGGMLGLGQLGAGGSGGGSTTSFLQSIFPQAKQTANALGVPVSGILAQSALETGWGSSRAYRGLNNPAGINVAGAATGTNYQGYANPASGFMGLQHLVASQYPGAMGQTSAAGYAGALQAGGYATDPHYASKITALANGPTIQGFLANSRP